MKRKAIFITRVRMMVMFEKTAGCAGRGQYKGL